MGGRIRRIWTWLRTPHGRYGAGVLLGAGMLLAGLGWGGFSAGVAYSNTMAFCTSCHEMRDFVYAEYQHTAHFSNASGVRAECADCHVPRAFWPKMVRKVEATFNELPKHFMGTLDSEAKFEAQRPRLAGRVWAAMKANDSRECRECHTTTAMALEEQRPRARAQHQDAVSSGETCIDCHKGIAHKLPPTPDDAGEEEAESDDFVL
jgi:nitrate/TMAO reductase-like tetraheme cytochrome c subunit